MIVKEEYRKPKIHSEVIEIGVYGQYDRLEFDDDFTPDDDAAT